MGVTSDHWPFEPCEPIASNLFANASSTEPIEYKTNKKTCKEKEFRATEPNFAFCFQFVWWGIKSSRNYRNAYTHTQKSRAQTPRQKKVLWSSCAREQKRARTVTRFSGNPFFHARNDNIQLCIPVCTLYLRSHWIRRVQWFRCSCKTWKGVNQR